MASFLSRVRQWLTGRRLMRHRNLTEVEYEAVSLIAYEGRAAYDRAREQAEYCRRCGSAPGAKFWSDVALEVARRTGAAGARKARQPPG